MRDIRYVVFHKPGPAWLPGKVMFEQPGVREHVAHYRKWLDAGKLELGGPYLDPAGGGMMVPVAGVPEDEITRFAAEDPAVKSATLLAEVRPWLIGMSKQDVMTVKRMDNIGIVVEDIDAAVEFFTELGLELEGRAPIEGAWADGVTGLPHMRVEIAMMRTPDGHSRLELSRFLTPRVVADHRNAPVNALGYLRVMFAVDDIDDTFARLSRRGAKLVGEVVQYQDIYRLCYIRGPEGILIGLAQQLERKTSRANPKQAHDGGA